MPTKPTPQPRPSPRPRPDDDWGERGYPPPPVRSTPTGEVISDDQFGRGPLLTTQRDEDRTRRAVPRGGDVRDRPTRGGIAASTVVPTFASGTMRCAT